MPDINLHDAADSVDQPNLKTYVAIVLDKSSSMEGTEKITVDNINEQIDALKTGSKDNMETQVSLYTFSGINHIDTIFEDQDVSSVEKFKRKDYHPGGMTALYSAIEKAIDHIETLPDINHVNTSVLVVIISDGQENASTSDAVESIPGRIKKLKKTERWTFTYLGAYIDAKQIESELNIDAGNIVSLASTADMTTQGLMSNTTGTIRYMAARSVGTASMDSFYNDTDTPEGTGESTDTTDATQD